MPFVIAGAVALFVVFLAGAAFLGQSESSPSPVGTRARSVTVAEIARLELSTTPDALAKRLGVEAKDNGLSVELRGSPFTFIGFHWDKDHLEHVKLVTLTAPSSGVPAEVTERAKAQLGRTFRPAATGGHQFSSGGAGFSIGSGVQASVHVFEDPRWKQQMAAMFVVLKGAALGTSDVLDERTKRDILNLDYPLARVADVDTGATVDGAEREVRRVFPGAVSAAEVHRVGLGHAWLDSAVLVWNNEPRGKFDRVNLYFSPEFDFKAEREDVERCLTPDLGAPRVIVANHLAGDVTLTFDSKPKQVYAHVSHQLIQLRPDADSEEARRAFKKALVTLSSCR